MKTLNQSIVKTSLLGFTLSFICLNGAQAQVAGTTQPKPDSHPYFAQTLIYPTVGGVQALGAGLRSQSIMGTDGKFKTLTASLLVEQSGAIPGVIAQGENYAFLAGGLLQTVSADGLVLTLPVSYTPDQMGGMYFTKKTTHEVVVIDSYANFYDTGVVAQPTLLGGSFYISLDSKTQLPQITVFKSTGTPFVGTDGKMYHSTANMAWTHPEDMSKVISAGGNYFINSDGTLGTVDSLNGYVYTNLAADSLPPKSGMGGNFFIGKDRNFYTVDYLGFVKKFGQIQVEKIKKLGYSYIEFNDETVIFVDAKGTTHTSAVEYPANGSAYELTHIPAAGMARDGAKNQSFQIK
jgi:hypothetical protein